MRTSRMLLLGLLGGGEQTSWPLAAPSPTLGEELLTDPGFDTGAGWSVGSDWSISGSQAVATNAIDDLKQDVSAVAGYWYRVVVDVATNTSGTLYQSSVGFAAYSCVSSDGITIDMFADGVGSSASSFRLIGAFWTGALDGCSVKHLSDILSGVDTHAAQHKVSAGITAPVNRCAGVWSDGDARTTPQNYLLAFVDMYNERLRLLQYVSGVLDTYIDCGYIPYSATAVLEIVPSGNDRLIKYGGSTVYTHTLTDSALIDGTCAGIMCTDSGVVFTDAEAALNFI